MQRKLEPELMLDQTQCIEFYNSVPEILFQEKTNLLPANMIGTVGELGCGPAVFTNILRNKFSDIIIDAYDGSEMMLNIARTHLDSLERINLINALIENVDKKYDTIVSLNTLHHIPDPKVFWDAIKRMSKESSKILVVDLVRPSSEELVYSIVNCVLRNENENSFFRTDFINSLMAAFTKEEVEEQVKELNCSVSILTFLGINYLVIKNYV